VPSISKSNQYASSDLACYFSACDCIMIYIRNLNWNLSNYSTRRTRRVRRIQSSVALVGAGNVLRLRRLGRPTAGDAVRPQLLLLPPPAGHFTSSPRVSSRACQRTRPAGKRAASARLGLFLLAPPSFNGLDREGPKAGFALWCSGLRSSSTYPLSFLCGPDFFIYAPIGGRW
jgi:hypothetical protein